MSAYKAKTAAIEAVARNAKPTAGKSKLRKKMKAYAKKAKATY